MSKKIVDLVIQCDGLILEDESVDDVIDYLDKRYPSLYKKQLEVTYEETVDD